MDSFQMFVPFLTRLLEFFFYGVKFCHNRLSGFLQELLPALNGLAEFLVSGLKSLHL